MKHYIQGLVGQKKEKSSVTSHILEGGYKIGLDNFKLIKEETVTKASKFIKIGLVL